MRRVHLVRAEHAARGDHADRELPFLHDAGLDRRRLRAQKDILCNIEGILLVLGRMVRGNVQLREIIVIVLDLRAFDDFIAHPDEDALDFLQRDRVRMTVADKFHFGRKRHVDFLLRELLLHLKRVESLPGLLHLRLDRVAGFIDPLADLRAVFRRDVLHGFEDSRERTLLAEKCDAHIVEHVKTGGCIHLSKRLLLDFLYLLLNINHNCLPTNFLTCADTQMIV